MADWLALRKSAGSIDCFAPRSHACVWVQHMQIQTKFLWLSRAATVGEAIDGWQVCWVGGWDRCRVFFVVMVMKKRHVTAAVACVISTRLKIGTGVNGGAAQHQRKLPRLHRFELADHCLGPRRI